MARKCVICGGRLRTGTKYCHKHRSEGWYGKDERDDKPLFKKSLNRETLPYIIIIFLSLPIGLVSLILGNIFLGIITLIAFILAVFMGIKIETRQRKEGLY